MNTAPIAQPAPPAFVEVRSPITKRLLFRYDPQSQTVEIKPKHGAVEHIRLAEVRPSEALTNVV